MVGATIRRGGGLVGGGCDWGATNRPDFDISGLTSKLATFDKPLESSRQALSDDVLMSGIVKGLGHQWSVRPSEGVAALSGAGAKPQALAPKPLPFRPPFGKGLPHTQGQGCVPKNRAGGSGGVGNEGSPSPRLPRRTTAAHLRRLRPTSDGSAGGRPRRKRGRP